VRISGGERAAASDIGRTKRYKPLER